MITRAVAVLDAHRRVASSCECGFDLGISAIVWHWQEHVAAAVIAELGLKREVKREQTGTANPEWRHRLLYDPVITHRYVTDWVVAE